MERRVLGIAGGPGAGKSTFAASFAGPNVAVVGMDGWHLAGSVLDRLGRRERKGAPDTFDAAGFVAFLARVRDGWASGETVWAPEFRREIEEPVAGAIEVGPDVTLVVVEGNYLLLDEPPWDRVASLLDECWFLAPDDTLRRERLIERHRRHGRSEAEAIARADGSDAANARLIAGTARRADRVLRAW